MPSPQQKTSSKTTDVKKISSNVTASNAIENDICEKDCICDEIKIKQLDDIEKAPTFLGIPADSFVRNLVVSDILNTPVCKKRL